MTKLFCDYCGELIPRGDGKHGFVAQVHLDLDSKLKLVDVHIEFNPYGSRGQIMCEYCRDLAIDLVYQELVKKREKDTAT